MTEPRVLIVDDQALVRAGFAMILMAAGIEVVGEAVDGDAAVVAARQLRPDVVLMDIRMPGLDGLAATRRILADHPTTEDGNPVRVIVLTTFDLDRYVYDALRDRVQAVVLACETGLVRPGTRNSAAPPGASTDDPGR